MLFKAKVLGKLQYGLAFVKPFLQRDIDLLENVQRKFTKFLCSDETLGYEQRLQKQGWPTVKCLSEIQMLTFLYRCYVYDNTADLVINFGNVRNTRARRFFSSSVERLRQKHFSNLAPYYGVSLFQQFVNSKKYVSDADYKLMMDKDMPVESFRIRCRQFVLSLWL